MTRSATATTARRQNVLTGVYRGRGMVAFDYSYETHSTDSQGHRSTSTHRYAVCSLGLPAPVGTVEIVPEGLLGRLGTALGMPDVELESEDFNRALPGAARDPKLAYDLLPPRTMEAAAAPSGPSPARLRRRCCLLGERVARPRRAARPARHARGAARRRAVLRLVPGGVCMTALLVVLGLLLALALAVVVSYNRFVRQRNLVAESWRQVDVELTPAPRADPQPRRDREGLRRAREDRAGAGDRGSRGGALARRRCPRPPRRRPGSRGSLRGLFAVAEAYPDLKAAGPFQQLQAQLAETEDRIAAGRRFYNGNVRALNTRVEAFPSSIVASAFHFEKAEYFEADDPAVRAPSPSTSAPTRRRRRPAAGGDSPPQSSTLWR